MGTLVALPIIGYVSDRFGRKLTLALSGVVEGVLGIIKALSVNYAMFLAFEFLEPALGSGVYTAAYVLGKFYYIIGLTFEKKPYMKLEIVK